MKPRTEVKIGQGIGGRHQSPVATFGEAPCTLRYSSRLSPPLGAMIEKVEKVGSALFTLGMLPFGVAVVAAAAVGLVGRVLPRWLAWSASQ